MNALITGSNGSCAYYLNQALGGSHGLVRGDSVIERIDTVRPDVIYHLAADADVRGSFDHPNQTFLNNTGITVALFEACRKVGIKPVVVICSTSEVYGNPVTWPITEDFPTIHQTNPYAVSKMAQELIANYYENCYGFPIVKTRAFGYVNPRRRQLSLCSFARQIVEIEEGRRSELRHGNLRSVRTFCDVRDIAKAYIKAAEHPGETFNIGSESPCSIRAALEILIYYAKAEIITHEDAALMRPLDVTNIIPDCSRFRKATGWEPTIPLKGSLKWLLETCRASRSQ